MRKRLWSSTRPTIQTFVYSPLARCRKNGPLMSMCQSSFGPAALVGRAVLPAHRGAGGAERGEEGVDGVVAERVDVPPRELGREALAVPVGQQADDDDRLLDPGRQSLPARAAGSIAQGLDATGLVAGAASGGGSPG